MSWSPSFPPCLSPTLFPLGGQGGGGLSFARASVGGRVSFVRAGSVLMMVWAFVVPVARQPIEAKGRPTNAPNSRPAALSFTP